MRKFQRRPAPAFLTMKWEQWGKEWEERHAENPKTSFYWHQVGGEQVNHKLLPDLKAQVQDHCSFCDNFPISPPSKNTIEHFRPKTTFPLEAFKWENLYYCCDFCQGNKGEKFDEALLEPDTPDYVFERFFCWDYTQGTLEVNLQATPQDQYRAKVTIDLYGLNKAHPSLRRRALRHRAKSPDEPLDDFAYRDFVEPLPT